MVRFDAEHNPQWCPGCGNFGLINALKKALEELGKKPEETVVASGIGCSGKSPHYVYSYGFEGLHGRALPVASGVKLANHKLTVIAEGGDGDGYGIGSAHFLHIMRRNYDLTYIVHDNQIYGLTTGQASPTTEKGAKTKTTPFGNIEEPIKPILLALVNGATFVARGYAGDFLQLKEIFKQAIEHKGFALVDVFQPCVSFNKLNTYQWFRERIYKLENYDPTDYKAALEKAMEPYITNYEKIPTGVIYKRDDLPTYESLLPQLKEEALVEKELNPKIVEKSLEEFM